MGRQVKTFKKPNLLKCVLKQSCFKISHDNIHTLVELFITEGILDPEQPYSVGIDKEHVDLGIPEHVHINGFTKYANSYCKNKFNLIILDENLFYKDKVKKGSYSLISKISDLKNDEDLDAYLRYPLKDTPVIRPSTWTDEKSEAQITLGKKEYHYKLNGKRERAKQEQRKYNVYEYLDTVVDTHEYQTVAIRHCLYDYARDNVRADLMCLRKLRQITAIYLLKNYRITHEELDSFL